MSFIIANQMTHTYRAIHPLPHTYKHTHHKKKHPTTLTANFVLNNSLKDGPHENSGSYKMFMRLLYACTYTKQGKVINFVLIAIYYIICIIDFQNFNSHCRGYSYMPRSKIGICCAWWLLLRFLTIVYNYRQHARENSYIPI